MTGTKYELLMTKVQEALDDEGLIGLYEVQTVEDMASLIVGVLEGEGVTEGEKRGAIEKGKALAEYLLSNVPKYRDDIEGMQRVYRAHEVLLCALARHDFDSYAQFIEWDREPRKRFYLPRRKQLLPVAKALQELEDDEIDLLCVSEPPGVGKTGLAIFYVTWLGGRHPDKSILIGSHNTAFLRGVYQEMLRTIDANGEYRWQQVFPGVHIESTNAQDLMIDLAEGEAGGKRFTTFEMTSIGAGNAGKVRAQTLLYCDDLVSGLEEALSRERMDKLWETYTTDLRQRKIGACKELHIATRWSIFDPIGRLEELYGADPRAKFIREAALDENDESRYDYPYGVGFTTEQFHLQRRIMDEASWRALFMNEPIEREGQLYSPQDLRRYMALPDGEPDTVLSVCDTKNKGDDYCVCPCVLQYGDDYYIKAVICDDGKPDVIERRLVKFHLDNHIVMSRFESNVGGDVVARNVQKAVNEQGGVLKIETKYTTANKEAKIQTRSGWVKEHVIFPDESLYLGDREMQLFMRMLTGYSMKNRSKKAHDDVPDALAQLADYVGNMHRGKVEVILRPF